MKILVCTNKHCISNNSEAILKKLKDYDIEFTHSLCMDMCEDGPNLFVFPQLKMYKNVDEKKLEDIVNNNAVGVEFANEIYDLNITNEYNTDPMHKRTVKLFRWHLDKYTDFSIAHLTKLVEEFTAKYDIKGTTFTNPIKVALINTISGPDLPELIHYLEKNRTMKLLDENLKRLNL